MSITWNRLNRMAEQAQADLRAGAVITDLSVEARHAHEAINTYGLRERDIADHIRTKKGFWGAPATRLTSDDWHQMASEIHEERVARGEIVRDATLEKVRATHTLETEKHKLTTGTELEKHRIDAKYQLEKHAKDAKYYAETGWWERRGNNIKNGWNRLHAPGEYVNAKIAKGMKWGAAAAVVGGVAAYLFNRSGKAAAESASAEIAANAGPAFDPSDAVMSADSAMMPEPIGMGPKGPIYGEHTARANGIEEGKAIPPRMSAGSFEDAATAAQKYASKDTGPQPSLAV